MTRVRIRLPENLVAEIDKWVEAGQFKNRSDAIKTIVILHVERAKTREFFEMLNTRSREVEGNPEKIFYLKALV